MIVHTSYFFSASTSLQSTHATEIVFLTLQPMALENLLEFSPIGWPYSLSIILILPMLGGLANMSSNLVMPLPFLFFCGLLWKSVTSDFKHEKHLCNIASYCLHCNYTAIPWLSHKKSPVESQPRSSSIWSSFAISAWFFCRLGHRLWPSLAASFLL